MNLYYLAHGIYSFLCRKCEKIIYVAFWQSEATIIFLNIDNFLSKSYVVNKALHCCGLNNVSLKFCILPEQNMQISERASRLPFAYLDYCTNTPCVFRETQTHNIWITFAGHIRFRYRIKNSKSIKEWL